MSNSTIITQPNPYLHYNFNRIDIIISSVLAFPSIIINLFLFCFIDRNKSKNSQLLSTIVLCEALCLFCIMCVVLENDLKDLKVIIYKVLNLITFGLLPAIGADYDNFYTIFQLCTIAIIHSMLTMSFCLHVFICIEIIISIKNPFLPNKVRSKLYIVISYLFTGSVFILKVVSCNMDDREGGLLSNSVLYINNILFFAFFVTGAASTIILIKRFCRKDSFASEMTRVYIIRKVVYALLYGASFGLSQINNFCIAIGQPEYSLQVIQLYSKLLK